MANIDIQHDIQMYIVLYLHNETFGTIGIQYTSLYNFITAHQLQYVSLSG